MRPLQIGALFGLISLAMIAFMLLWIERMSPLISPNDAANSTSDFQTTAPPIDSSADLSAYPTSTGVNASLDGIASYLHLMSASNRSRIVAPSANQRVTHLVHGQIRHDTLKSRLVADSDSAASTSFDTLAQQADSMSDDWTTQSVLNTFASSPSGTDRQTSKHASYLLHFSQPLNDSAKLCINSTLLQCCGYALHHYVPHHTYTAVPFSDRPRHAAIGASMLRRSVNEACSDSASSTPLVLTSLRYSDEHKIDPTLLTKARNWRHEPNDASDDAESAYFSLYANLPVTPFCSNAQQLERDWAIELQRIISDRRLLSRQIDDKTLQFTLLSSASSSNSKSALRLLSWLSSQDCVEWLDEAIDSFETHNFHATRQIQSGRMSQDDSVSRVLHAHGITGRNVIIAHGDTGIDHRSCFFRDSTRPMPFNTFDFSHRKIVTYQTVVNSSTDLPSGHGTHTSASLAGSIEQTDPEFATSSALQRLSRYDGVAFAARIAEYDFNDGRTRTKIKSPRDIYGKYYARAHHEARASITTNSFGSRNATYIREATETDRFIYDNPHFLALYSSGNFGQRGAQSVVAPGVAKSALTIGSVRSTNLRFAEGEVDDNGLPRPLTCDSEFPDQESEALQHRIAPFSGQGPTLDGRVKPDVLTAGAYVISARSKGQPENEDADLPPGESLQSEVEPPEECESCADSLLPLLGTSMSTALAAGAAALVQQYYEDGYRCTGRPKASCSHRPSAALIKATIIHSAVNDVQLDSMEGASGFDEPTGVEMDDSRSNADVAQFRQAHLAYKRDFGSRFNALAARRLDSLRGQRDTGDASASDFAHNPYCVNASSSGASDDDETVLLFPSRWSPNPVSGFGRIQLNNALKLAEDASQSRARLHFIHDETNHQLGLATGQEFTACFIVESWSGSRSDSAADSNKVSEKFRSTLVWNDPPASRLSLVQLINDLDLTVDLYAADSSDVRQPTIRQLGNQWASCSGTQQRDHINNVEQVTIAEEDLQPGDRIKVTVSGVHVPVARQAFALIVTGPLREIADATRCNSPLQ